MAAVNMSEDAISEIEGGRFSDTSTLKKLAKALDVAPELLARR
jgi:hypothetical protein